MSFFFLYLLLSLLLYWLILKYWNFKQCQQQQQKIYNRKNYDITISVVTLKHMKESTSGICVVSVLNCKRYALKMTAIDRSISKHYNLSNSLKLHYFTLKNCFFFLFIWISNLVKIFRQYFSANLKSWQRLLKIMTKLLAIVRHYCWYSAVKIFQFRCFTSNNKNIWVKKLE